ncbi:MAG: glycosyltransferase [Planctomycetota bacterium]|nr:glycosyltransferase [Planctomycetota bacterium]
MDAWILISKRGFKAWVKTRFFKLATHFAVYGQRGKQICIEKGINPERIAVVNNSLPCIRAGNAEYSAPLDEIRKFKASVFSQPQHPVIVWIGRLLEINRLECLLVSACELRRRNCPINVLIIGDGEAASSLSSLAEELGLNDNVHFAGACYDESKIGLMLSSSDLFVAPARTGLSCIHALSYGVPVLTSDNFDKQCPEHEAVLPGKTGFFFDHTEEGALVDAIKESLDKFSNTETRDLCRKTAYEMFSVERHAERLLNAMMGKGK